MEQKRSIRGLAIALFLLLVCVSWYSGQSDVTEYTENVEERIYHDSASVFFKKYDPNLLYYSTQKVLITKKRTLIPFKYDKKEIGISKLEYYSKENPSNKKE